METHEDIKNNFRTFLRSKLKNESTVKQYVDKLDEAAKWFIENGVCDKAYVIWTDIETAKEIQSKLKSTPLAGKWLAFNREINGWYSAPWKKWVEYLNPGKSQPKAKHRSLHWWQDLSNDLSTSNINIQEELVLRFIGSLVAKNFLILTGLSGSGKTILATSLASWLDAGGPSKENGPEFKVGDRLVGPKVAYRIIAADRLSVTFLQEQTSTKVSVPVELIEEWVTAIKLHNFSSKTTPRTMRDAVEATTKYSPQLNSFETHLKAAALYLIEKRDNAPTTKPKRSKVISVGADWTNRDPLLGYPDALNPKEYITTENSVVDLITRAESDPEMPYFVILDEMNLSHVERYFSDFLSAMELKGDHRRIALHSNDNISSVPKQISLPPNLFIIGTVNIDETTYMFSPKVLDRANVIEFRVASKEMTAFLANNNTVDFDRLAGKGSKMAASMVELARQRPELDQKSRDAIGAELNRFFNALQVVGAEFGYRTASEIIRFAGMIRQLDSSKDDRWILDVAIMQKLLPKLHGSRRRLSATLEKLAGLCWEDKLVTLEELYRRFSEYSELDIKGCKYPISLEKLFRMYRNLVENGFTSYAEA